MPNKKIIILGLSLVIGYFSCNNKSKQELSVNKEEIDTVSVEENRCRNSLNILIENFYKYRDENHLFEGITDDCWYGDRFPHDTLLIFNFEKGTIRRIGIYDTEDYLSKNKANDFIPEYVNYIKGFPTDREISGDFNGDGKIETMKMDLEPISKKFENGEIDYYEIEGFDFIFSDKKIPKLNVWGNDEYTIKNEGDLDGDGGDEIGFLYGWGTSTCRTYTVFTLKHNKWKELITIDSKYNMREFGILPIEKDPEQKGVVLIRTSGAYECCNRAVYVVEIPVKISELQKFKKENLKYLIQE